VSVRYKQNKNKRHLEMENLLSVQSEDFRVLEGNKASRDEVIQLHC